MTATAVKHIWLDDRGVAWIDDTNVKVIEVVLDYLVDGLSAEEIQYQHYHRFTLAQIHAALAYYFDQQAEFDAEIDRQLREHELLRTQAMGSPGRTRLRALGKLP